MYTLFYLPGACSLAVHVVLNELGVPFNLENVAVPQGQPRSAEFLEINPRGNVPVIKKDDFVLREGAAILIHLLETNQSPLLPNTGNERASALEWLAFANSSLHPAYGRLFFLNGQLGDKLAESPLFDAAIQNVQKHWDDVERVLHHSEYLAGSQITVADILVTVISNWSMRFPKPINFGAKTKELFKKVTDRPAFRKAMETEQVTYKVPLS